MRTFHCDACGQLVFFENTSCEKCRRTLAYLSDRMAIAALEPAGGDRWTTVADPPAIYRKCANYQQHYVCNWAVPADDPNPLCESCRLTAIIPNLTRPESRPAWERLEAAKRRLIFGLHAHRLPIQTRAENPTHGLVFKFLADANGQPVMTGHDDGVIVLNIAEADDVERERRRIAMREPYRTLLGHFRHEIGHYYWDVLIKSSDRLERFRWQFGDERVDYQQALKDHYAGGPKPNWRQAFVSDYASVHPWEDWAETWAHYLHMTDTMEMAAACGLGLEPPRDGEPILRRRPLRPVNEHRFDEIVGNWFPLTYLMNNLNRCMGEADAYPFVLPPPAIEKLRFVHDTICLAAASM